MLYFSFFYFVFLYGIFISNEILFFNEEVLIAACMILVFMFLVRSLRKVVNFALFFRAESIYFSFLNLILLNIKLIEKMLNLVNLESLRFESIILFQLYSFFNEFLIEITASLRSVNLMFVKNFIFSFVSNLYILNFFSSSNNFLTNTSVNNKGLLQEFSLADSSNFFVLPRSASSGLLNNLALTELYDIFLDNYNDLYNDEDYLTEDLVFLGDFAIFN